MTEAVLDASVFVAAHVRAEVHHEAAVALVASVPEGQPFVVPSLFRAEVVAAFARRAFPDETIDAVVSLLATPKFAYESVDDALVDEALKIARKGSLRAYDAIYAAVAVRREATLLTLDAELAERLRVACPRLRVLPKRRRK